jgi:methyl-accepting chemotaxis protein PixJ
MASEPSSGTTFYKAFGRFRLAFLPAVALTIILVGALTIERYKMQQALVASASKQAAAERHIGEVIYFDELLTMSARLAAATGGKEWISRYDEGVPKMTAALSALDALAPADIAKRLKDSTSTANDELIKIETAVFEKIKSGDLPGAQALFNSTYDQHKAVLTKGSDAFNAELLESIAQKRNAMESRFRMLVLGGSALLLPVLIAWIILFRGMRKTAQQAQEAEASRLQAEEERRSVLAKQSEEQEFKLQTRSHRSAATRKSFSRRQRKWLISPIQPQRFRMKSRRGATPRAI